MTCRNTIFANAVCLGVLLLAALGLPRTADAAWYWCEPSQAYYPWVSSCAEPWKSVDPRAPPRAPAASGPLANPAPAASAATQAGPAPQPPAAQGGLPTFPAPTSLTRGDALDEWCKGSTIALNIAVCGDNDLRALAIERLHAFDDASARVTTDQRKALTGDQNGWAMAYPQGCGLRSDTPPSLPLAPSVKECLMRAGQARLRYLRGYGTPGAKDEAAPSGTAVAATAAPPDSSAALQPNAPAAPSAVGLAGTQPPSSAPALPPSPTTETTTPAQPPPALPTSSTRPAPTNSALLPRRPTLDVFAAGIRVAAVLLCLVVVGLWVWLALRSKAEGVRRQDASGAPKLR